eukprot:762616-Hanusia_phi.AAC.1
MAPAFRRAHGATSARTSRSLSIESVGPGLSPLRVRQASGKDILRTCGKASRELGPVHPNELQRLREIVISTIEKIEMDKEEHISRP